MWDLWWYGSCDSVERVKDNLYLQHVGYNFQYHFSLLSNTLDKPVYGVCSREKH